MCSCLKRAILMSFRCVLGSVVSGVGCGSLSLCGCCGGVSVALGVVLALCGSLGLLVGVWVCWRVFVSLWWCFRCRVVFSLGRHIVYLVDTLSTKTKKTSHTK